VFPKERVWGGRLTFLVGEEGPLRRDQIVRKKKSLRP